MNSNSTAPKKLSIVIPAYCEEERLAATVEEVVSAASATLDPFEAIVVNDGSTDGTRDVADKLAAVFPAVKVIHFEHNRGVGAAFQAALERAQFEYISLVPGDRAFEKSGLLDLFAAVGTADMVISYRANPQTRTPLRLLLSRIYTLQLQLTTRCGIRDGSSLYVWPVALTRQIPFPPDYSYHLFTMTYLLQQVSSYTELPVMMTPKPDHSSRVMHWRVVMTLALRLSLLTLKSLARIGQPRPCRVVLASAA